VTTRFAALPLFPNLSTGVLVFILRVFVLVAFAIPVTILLVPAALAATSTAGPPAQITECSSAASERLVIEFAVTVIGQHIRAPANASSAKNETQRGP
jgi:hypothetical protein